MVKVSIIRDTNRSEHLFNRAKLLTAKLQDAIQE